MFSSRSDGVVPYASAGAAGPKRLTDESFKSHVLEFLARPAVRSPESGVRSLQLTSRVPVRPWTGS